LGTPVRGNGTELDLRGGFGELNLTDSADAIPAERQHDAAGHEG
jgi:hypothetical protein